MNIIGGYAIKNKETKPNQSNFKEKWDTYITSTAKGTVKTVEKFYQSRSIFVIPLQNSDLT